MRRMIIGLALAVLAMGPPSQVRASDAEDKAAAQEIADLLRDERQDPQLQRGGQIQGRHGLA